MNRSRTGPGRLRAAPRARAANGLGLARGSAVGLVLWVLVASFVAGIPVVAPPHAAPSAHLAASAQNAQGSGAVLGPLVRPASPSVPYSAPTSSPVGRVGYTWDLTNDTVSPRPFVPSLHWEPSALAIDPSTGTLWVAWGPNPLGARDNISLVNLTTGEVVGEVPGTANATGLLYVASLNVMFVTQTTRSNGLGRVLFLNATTGAPVASAVPVGIDPAAMAYDPYASLLYVMSNGTGIASSIAFPSGQVDDPYIPVGSNPDSAVYDPASGNIYVANWGSGNITVLNGSTGSPVGPGIGYPGASQPIDLIFDPATGFVYVTFLTQTDAHAAIGWLDPAIDAAVGESEFDNPGIEPAATALDPSTGLFLMPLRYTYGSLGLVTFDPLSESWNFSGVFPPGPVGAYASLEVVDDATQTDYIAHAFDPTSAGPSYLTTVWLRNSSGGPIVLLGASARSGTYDPEDGRVYIADSFTTTIYGSEPDSVAAINASGGPVLSTTPIGYGGIGLSAGYAPQTVGYDPANHELIVVDGGSQYAVELNASTGAYAGQFTTGSYLTSAGTLPNDSASWGSEVAYDPVHGRLYLSGPTGGIVGLYAGNLSTFFGAFAESPVPTEAGWIESLPYQDVAVNPSTGLVYEVAPADLLGGGGTVTVYDPFTTGPNASGKFLLGVHGGGFGSGIAFDPVDSSMYVTDARANVVYVLNASSMANGYTAEEIPVGSDPTAIAFDPDTGSILVADTGSSNVTVLNGSTQPAGLVGAVSLPTAPGPSALIVDPSQDTVLVTSSLVGTVQAISPSPQIYSYSVSRPSTDVGVPVSLATVAVGGVGAPHYHYGDLPPGCTSSDGPTMVCDPTGPGTFSVQLTITDSGPFNTTAARVLTVAPDPSISLTPTSLTVDVGLTFGASVVVANGTGPLDVLWSFGDGGTANGTSAEHVFERPGDYSTQAEVVDALGESAVDRRTIHVGSTLDSAISGPANGSSGSPVSFSAEALAGVAPYRFVWTFGDGNAVQTGVIGSNAPNSSRVSHTYAGAATYHVTVLVVDGGGERSLSSWNVTVGPASVPPPGGGPSGSSGGSIASTSEIPTGFLVADLVAAVVILGLLLRKPPARRSS